MTKKEHTTITELFQVLDLLESLDMQFWLDGGWGVDVLYGQQTRLHRDIDIDFDANYTVQLLVVHDNMKPIQAFELFNELKSK